MKIKTTSKCPARQRGQSGEALPRRRRCFGFTLPELLVAMTVLSILLLMLSELLNQVQKTWTFSENRISQFREARVGFDIITKNLSQAALNTYWEPEKDPDSQVILRYKRQSELHFKSGKATELGLDSKAVTHALFFQAPLGFSLRFNNLGTLYNARGYYVEFSDDLRFKPSFVKAQPKYRFRLMEYLPPAEENQIYNDGDEERYNNLEADYDKWYRYNLPEHTHPLADNIVALIVSPRESLGDASTAAGVYKLAPNYSYDSNDVNLDNPQQVPPLVHVTMVAIDESSAVRFEKGAAAPREIMDAVDSRFTSVASYASDLAAMEQELRGKDVNYRVFSSMVAIRSSKWSTF